MRFISRDYHCTALLSRSARSVTYQRPLPVSTTRHSVRAGSVLTHDASVMDTRTAALVPMRQAAMVSELLERRRRATCRD